MVRTGSVVASESLSGSGRRHDVGAVDGKIAEMWFVSERKWISKRLGNNAGLESALLEVHQWAGCWSPLEVDHWEAWS